MLETIFSVELGVAEELSVKRIRYTPLDKKSKKRISIVTGIHGDELEGQMVSFLLNNFLSKNKEAVRETIDVYPVVNPLGIDVSTRNVPPEDIDLNRIFPGSKNGTLPERIAYALVEAVKGSDIVIDIHSSNIFLREVPQARINSEYARRLVPLALKMNLDFIWVHRPVDNLYSTFTCSMNKLGSRAVLIEMGIGLRITKNYSYQVFNGILNLLVEEGFLDYKIPVPIKEPPLSVRGKIHFIYAEHPGIFVNNQKHGQILKKGEIIGSVVSPHTGEELEIVVSPADGLLFTLREHPLVYPGSLLARVFEE
jgi:predicted deacylase